MAITTALYPQGAAMGSQVRASQELVNANTLLDLSQALGAAGCARATTAAKAKTVNSISYNLLGSILTLAGTDNLWTLGTTTSATAVAASSWQKYLLLVDGSQNPFVYEGLQSTVGASSVAWTNISSYSKYAGLMTALNGVRAIIGVLTIATNSSTTFTPGTTALNASGVTATFIDGVDQTLIPLIANDYGNLLGNGG